MAKDRAWLSSIEIQAAAVKSNTPIYVYEQPWDGEDRQFRKYIFGPEGKKEPIALEYNGNHYRYFKGRVPDEDR
eukprot:12405590-Karenia_brevis.AAC.1